MQKINLRLKSLSEIIATDPNDLVQLAPKFKITIENTELQNTIQLESNEELMNIFKESIANLLESQYNIIKA